MTSPAVNVLGPLPAPAKLNLFLHVLGRRSDGYHELQTVFQLIDLCDEISLHLRSDGLIKRHEPIDPAMLSVSEAQDLTVRAARALQLASGCALGVEIQLRKRIPSGGGLGGGSSDAATVLRGLNKLWNLEWSLSRLAQLGASLGADVPVFVMGENAFAGGRGDELTPLRLPLRWFAVIHPGVHVPTAEVFAATDLTRDTPALKIAALPKGGGRNDCEAVVRRGYPEVAKALDWLSRFGRARLTGTGASVFAEFDSEQAALAATRGLPQQWQGFAVAGLSASPLFVAGV